MYIYKVFILKKFHIQGGYVSKGVEASIIRIIIKISLTSALKFIHPCGGLAKILNMIDGLAFYFFTHECDHTIY